MQKILGYLRRAVQEFDLIQNGDRIAVGISGGKDSLVLLAALRDFQKFGLLDYTLVGITLDPQFGGIPTDYSAAAAFCEQLGVEYHLIPTQIGHIVIDVRKESSPCSLCAKMRRGALHDQAKAFGCNKLALGHHNDDAIETFLMNLFIEGRIGCYAPKSYLSRKDLTLIRPLSFAPERDIVHAAKLHVPEVVKSRCPVDGHTMRETMKAFIREQEKQNPGFKTRVFGAMRRANVDGWGGKTYVRDLAMDNPETNGKAERFHMLEQEIARRLKEGQYADLGN
ncbi:MAG: tRNA 2-thiocytidine(32) synthetase TtcA [Oscillospiraceae bacterium]|nr:tRNA 2-thiocytidine(32) synthetase TtcA [Oscillospiraceae bacterium]